MQNFVAVISRKLSRCYPDINIDSKVDFCCDRSPMLDVL
jgi:hypothetical protein